MLRADACGLRQHGKGAGSRFQSKAAASNKYRQSRSRGRFRRRAPPPPLLCHPRSGQHNLWRL